MDFKNHLMKSTTVSINRDLNETWIIFTDGAFEPTNTQPASIGGILLNPSGKVVHISELTFLDPCQTILHLLGFWLAVRSTTAQLRCLFLVMLVGVGIVIQLLFGHIFPFSHSGGFD